MTDYKPPVKEHDFILNHVVGLSDVTALPAYTDVTQDLVTAILTEAGRFVAEELAPLNRRGDMEGATLKEGVVTTAAGFKQAYQKYIEGGWNGMSATPDFGGQGLPLVVHNAVAEMANGANMAFMLCSLLNQGAIEALQSHGSKEQKDVYLHNIIAGHWTATMNLTEPQAGSDVGALRCKAVRQDAGHYLIEGQKIYITFGEHDMAENIVHLVLARTPDAPAGTRGISLFIVPKFLPDGEGGLGERNDVQAVSLEHKLGIHGSPTCVMSFGDKGNCIGYLLGEEFHGMRCMFTMMNSARLGVGLQGVGCAERAYQMALDYALQRVQGQPVGAEVGAPIIEHADIRRQLLTMKACIDASRLLCSYNSRAIDLSRHHPGPEVRAAQQGLADLLTPLSKAYGSDVGVEVASNAIQVFGGMGYIEEAGIAQLYRDSRIAPIYEGTNGIQAVDLVVRKLKQDDGRHWQTLFDECSALADEIVANTEMDAFRKAGRQLAMAVDTARDCAQFLSAQCETNMRAALAGASPFLRLMSMTVGSWLSLKAAVAAQQQMKQPESDADFLQQQITSACFFAEQLLPPATALSHAIKGGEGLLFGLAADVQIDE